MYGPPGCGKTMLAKVRFHSKSPFSVQNDNLKDIFWTENVCFKSKTVQRLLLIIHLQPSSLLSDQNLFKNILVKVQEWFEMFFNLQEKIHQQLYLSMKSTLLQPDDLTPRLGITSFTGAILQIYAHQVASESVHEAVAHRNIPFQDWCRS